jgi:hypothetical protein
LQAREIIRGKTFTENASVCVFTNQTTVSHGVEVLPQPERLRDDRSSRKTKKYTSNPATSEESAKFSSSLSIVKFPLEVEVLQNASDYARVVEPLQPVDSKMR